MNAFDAVVICESVIQPGEVGIEQRQDAEILAHDGGKQMFRFFGHRQTQILVERIGIRCNRAELAQKQPLCRKVLDQCVGFGIGQHPLYL